MDLDLDQRLRILEAGVDIQSQILANIQAELIEADRLSSSVERLGDGASELGKALLQVDKNQQALTKLGLQIDAVEKQAAKKNEVAEHAEAIRQTRRKTLVGAGLIAAGVAVAAGLGMFALSHASYDSCERRQETTRVFVALLGDFKSGGRGDARIDRGIERLEATLDRTCAEQYPLHLP